MNNYLITYDLLKPGQNYEKLYEAIKALGAWWHCLDSNWIVKSSLTAVQIRDALIIHLDANDKLLVAKLAGDAAWRGFDNECSGWLKTNL